MCQCIEKYIIFHELFGTSTTCVVTQEDISAQSVPAVHSFQCLHLFVHLSRPDTAENGEANVSVHRKRYHFSCIIRDVHDVRSDAGRHLCSISASSSQFSMSALVCTSIQATYSSKRRSECVSALKNILFFMNYSGRPRRA